MAKTTKAKAPAAAPIEAAETVDNMNVREPVTARGTDLMKLIQENNGMYLTGDEGSQLVAEGLAQVGDEGSQLVAEGLAQVGEIKEDGTAMVTLTKAGSEAIGTNESKASGTTYLYEVDDDVPMPTGRTRGPGKRPSKYPFEILEVGKSFHVSVSADNSDPASALASSITAARRRFAQPVIDAKTGKPVQETVEVTNYQLDANGKRVKDANGNWIEIGKEMQTRPKMVDTREFTVARVGKEDPRGPGARVFRKK